MRAFAWPYGEVGVVSLVYTQCSLLYYFQLQRDDCGWDRVSGAVLFTVLSHTACVILALIQQDSCAWDLSDYKLNIAVNSRCLTLLAGSSIPSALEGES